MRAPMRALLLLSIIGLFTPQGPKELWLQGERARAITALSAELEESESPTGRQQLVEWCLAVHRYRAALDEAEKDKYAEESNKLKQDRMTKVLEAREAAKEKAKAAKEKERKERWDEDD